MTAYLNLQLTPRLILTLQDIEVFICFYNYRILVSSSSGNGF